MKKSHNISLRKFFLLFVYIHCQTLNQGHWGQVPNMNWKWQFFRFHSHLSTIDCVRNYLLPPKMDFLNNGEFLLLLPLRRIKRRDLCLHYYFFKFCKSTHCNALYKSENLYIKVRRELQKFSKLLKRFRF